MPKDRKKAMSDDELSQMFLNIGRAKEAAAEGIIAEQKKEEEEKRRQLKGKLKIFGGAGEEFGEDVDYDEEVRALEQEIEWVRSGKVHKYDSGVVLTEEDSERPDALENLVDTPEKIETSEQTETSDSNDSDNFEILGVPDEETGNIEVDNPEQTVSEIELDEPVIEESTPEAPALEPDVQAEPEFELDDVASEPDILRVYFATAYDAQTGVGHFAFDAYKGDILLESKTGNIVDSKAETVVFVGASKMLQYIQSTKSTSALLIMSEKAETLLRKNAIYGLTGDFGYAAIEYIRKVKELSAECYLRVLSGIHTQEMSAVTQHIQIS